MVALATLLACESGERAPGTASGSARPAPPPPGAVSTDATASDLDEHMREHFASIAELQRATARGRLATAKADALWLVDHDEPAKLAAWRPFVTEMRQAALEFMATRDLPSAAAVASRLGRTCSRCHEATSAVVTFAWETPPPDAPNLPAQMKRHEWAAARLWEGLVGPSDTMWRGGAGVLATTRLDVRAASGSATPPRGDVEALAKYVRELATTATGIDDQDARAKLYGELLSTCAGCHALVRPDPVSEPVRDR